MDDQPEGGAERPAPGGPGGALGEGQEPNAPTWPAAEPPPSGPEVTALADQAAEIRRLVDAGAGSPEALRELATRLREHRSREEALWRAEVKPLLVKEGKGRFRGHSKPAPERSERSNLRSQRAWLAGGLLALLLLVVLAANTTVWVLLLPALALLVGAWNQGRRDLGG